MTFWYLATPYSHFEAGHEAAWIAACEQTAFLMRQGLRVFSPIAHSHPVALHGGLNALDHDLWLGHDEALMQSALGMIQCRLPGWAESYGMTWERDWFTARNKPVVPMQPGEWPQFFDRVAP